MPMPAVPLEKKRLLGNPGKRALVPQDETIAVPMATEVPEPPAHLTGIGLEAWGRVWTKCALWVSPDLDLGIITRYCEHLQIRQALLEAIETEGYLVDGKPHPALLRIKDFESMIARAESKLALNPADRSSMGYIEVRKESALQTFLKQSNGQSPTRKAIDAEVGEADDHDYNS